MKKSTLQSVDNCAKSEDSDQLAAKYGALKLKNATNYSGMRLKYQVFLTLLLASGLLIVLMFAFNSWSFNRGFLNYLSNSRQQSIAPLVDQLSSAYVENGSWQWLLDDRRNWSELLDSVPGVRRPPRRPPRGGNSDRNNRPVDSQRDGSARGAGERTDRGPEGGRPSAPGRLSEGGQAAQFELMLADTDKQILVGRSTRLDNIRWQAIEVDDDIVGYLGFRQFSELPDEIDKVFARQQKTSFAYAAIAMVLLSALLAIALASRIVRPLLDMIAAVAHIGSGNFKHRVAQHRRDELGELSQVINQLAHSLETSQQTRRQWMAEISHELRTPVAVLQGEVEALQDGIQPLNDAALGSLHTEIRRLSRLIDDLHAMNLADAGALNYKMQPLSLDTLVDERLDQARQKASAESLTIEFTQSTQASTINGDAERLKQLIDNLMQNSMRYTHAGGQIVITLNQRSDTVELNWSDSAPGVADDQLPQLFDALYRTDTSRSREHGGAGLGLAIVSKIVHAHQGTITAQHSSLGGVAIVIRLPVYHGESRTPD